MDTLTTVEAIKRTPSGAFAVTMLGGKVAGTFDEELATVAKQALENDDPVGVVLNAKDGKLYLEKITIIEAPEELGGPADEPEKEAAEPVATEDPAPVDEPKIETGETMIDSNEEICTTADLDVAHARITTAHVTLNDTRDELATAGISVSALEPICELLAEASRSLRAARP